MPPPPTPYGGRLVTEHAINYFMTRNISITFNSDDYTDEINPRRYGQQEEHRVSPILLDKEGKRYQKNDFTPGKSVGRQEGKQVILVDHSLLEEPSQWQVSRLSLRLRQIIDNHLTGNGPDGSTQ